MGVQTIDTDFQGPLPPNTVGLILGRSSVTLRGVIIHPGVVDPDYTGVVKIMVSSPRGLAAISPGDRVAQLLLLPSLHDKFPASDQLRGDCGFGSTGNEIIAMSFDLGQRPTLKLWVEGKYILGLLDTGADRSVIATKDWSPGWPRQMASQTLRGLGYADTPQISARALHWKDEEKHEGQFTPYVLSLPISLWGRDLLQDMGYALQNPISKTAQNIMTNQGYHPSFGLGKHLQGHKSPIIPTPRLFRQGLGFS